MVHNRKPAARAEQRFRLSNGDPAKPRQPVQGGMANEIAAELQELAARAQSLPAKLHESGLMSAGDVTVAKKRFPF